MKNFESNQGFPLVEFPKNYEDILESVEAEETTNVTLLYSTILKNNLKFILIIVNFNNCKFYFIS